ncbi:hypothetical protein [Microcoleus sp. herbarium12]|uniref:hypothetical protein n=1 Tax=Microcoleus sp. herbarium12 TaxID=3055437 RepID=UPI002FD6190B
MSCTLQPGFYEKYGTYQRDTSLETWWVSRLLSGIGLLAKISVFNGSKLLSTFLYRPLITNFPISQFPNLKFKIPNLKSYDG